MSNYLIESSICLAAFYLFYWVFLHREKLLNINRAYLLLSVIISLIIPLLSIETSWSLLPSTQPIQETVSVEDPTASTSKNGSGIPFEMVYILGLNTSLVLLSIKLLIVKRKLGKNLSLKKKHIEVTETEGNEAFSFFNTIYIGRDLSSNQELREQIIAHEFAHIDGKHTLDTLFFELLKCFYWFNPFSYFYSKAAQLQHEFIADHYALSKSDARAYEKSLLELTLSKINPSLVANFGQHPIQKRLKMIKTINSNIMKRLKPLFALPVLGALVFALACTEEVTPETNEIVFEETEIPIDIDLKTTVKNVKRTYWNPTDSLSTSEIINGKVKVYFSPQIQKRVDLKIAQVTERKIDENTVVIEEEIPLSRVVSVETIKRD